MEYLLKLLIDKIESSENRKSLVKKERESFL